MNTKRQTIWLVSMLSLMVVLSAYYLFTEDVSKLNTVTEKVAQEDIKVTTEQKDPSAGDKAVSSGVASGISTGSSSGAASGKTSETGITSGTAAGTSSGDAKASGKASGDQNKSTDAQVLQQVAKTKTGTDYFVDLAYKRNQDLGKKIEGLQNIFGDAKKSADEISQAYAEFDKIQSVKEKMENLEDLLGKTYSNAIVLEDGSKYKAVVQVSGKLDAKQAQGIIDLMIQELGVTKEAVSVQYLN